MKTWQKKISAFLVILVIASAILIFFSDQKECCLCSCFRYHEPCLIDLKTGELLNLSLYMDHPTLVAELDSVQPQYGTFSFIRFNGITGTKQTGPEIIELDIPDDRTLFPSLCRECRRQLPLEYSSRFVLADLYDIEEKMLLPIVSDTAFMLRCYDIVMKENIDKNGFSVIIKGTWKK